WAGKQGRWTISLLAKRFGEQGSLFPLVGLLGAGGGAGAFGAGDGFPVMVAKASSQHMVLNKTPGSHVLGLLLHINNRRLRTVGFDRLEQLGVGERVVLLQAKDGHIVALVFLFLRQQVVVNLTR